MDTKPFDDFLAHWRTLPIAEGAKAPAKSTFSPQALKPHLPYIGIHERVDRYDLQVRLFGTLLDEKFDKAMTGLNLFDILAKEDWDFYAEYYENVLYTPAGCRMAREAPDANDNIVRGESFALPLADDSGKARFIVAMMLLESESALNDPMDATRLHQARVISVEYVDIGHGLPANPPPLPG